MKIQPLAPPDSHHLKAAEGWLGLGNHLEADAELDCITPQLRIHPDVLQLRWEVYAKAEKWEMCIHLGETLVAIAPDRTIGWINRSFALHKLKRTREAFDLLQPAAERFPQCATIPYNLGCYSCQLGELEQAGKWVHATFAIDENNGEPDLHKLMAMDDPDLEPLLKDLTT